MHVAVSSTVRWKPQGGERRTPGLETLLHDLDARMRDRVLELTRHLQRYDRGDAVYRVGGALSSLYAVQTGSFKSLAGLPDGRAQVVGYHIPGDIVGITGIASGAHTEDVIACELATLAAIPYADLATLARDDATLHRNMTRLLAVGSNRTMRTMVRLGAESAQARVADFLLALGERWARRGFSATRYVLNLPQTELATMLGLSPETVSRTISGFAKQGLLSREGRSFELIDVERLRKIAADAQAAR